jgi:hypothetical protein
MDATRRHSAAGVVGATMSVVTTREIAKRLLDELPDSEIDPVVEFIVSRRRGEANGASTRARRPRLGLGRSSDGLSAAETAGEPVARPLS